MKTIGTFLIFCVALTIAGSKVYAQEISMDALEQVKPDAVTIIR